LAKKADIRECLNAEIDERTEGTEEENDPDPVVIGTAADEVDDRKPLEDQAPGIKEVTEQAHEFGALRSLWE
jgi:hypothetical protein